MKRLLFFSCLLLSIAGYSQEKRLALVIGNSAYEHGGELRNPINDAFAMKQALTEVGFEVQEYYNLSQGDLKKAIDDFGLKLNGYDVGLFFYAGHGIQSKGYNYLIPVDANLINERQVEYDCVQANRVLAFMESSGAEINIVILDACRNNPFERSWNRSSSGKGLAFMDAPTGTLIAYATAPGSTSSDGVGKNGLYTEAILESLQIPNITALKMFQNVRGLVTVRSNHQQTPWESTSLTGDFYFIRGTEDNILPAQSSSPEVSTESRGKNTEIIDGYILTHQRFGRKKGVYLEDERLTRREFYLILKEAEAEYWKTMDKAWSNHSIGLYGMIGGGAMFIGYGLTSEFASGKENDKRYTGLALGSAAMAGIGFLYWLKGHKQYNTVLKSYFPDNFSSIKIGPTQNGIGLVYNF